MKERKKESSRTRERRREKEGKMQDFYTETNNVERSFQTRTRVPPVDMDINQSNWKRHRRRWWNDVG